MPGAIDSFGALPDGEVLASWVRCFARFRGYRRRFGERLGALAGFAPADFERAEPERIARELAARLAPRLPPLDDFVRSLERLEVDAVCVWVHAGAGAALERVTSAAQCFPGRFRALASYEPGGERVALVRRDAASAPLAGVCLLPIVDDRPADDPANDALFATCLELGLPVWVHAVATLSERHAVDFAHPRAVDRIARRFPDLRLVIGHGGWPWVGEAVAIAARHQHVYIEPSSFRWRDLATSGSGFEPLLLHGAGALAERVLFGSLWPLVGGDLARVVSEARALPLAADVLARWTGENARALYRLDGARGGGSQPTG